MKSTSTYSNVYYLLALLIFFSAIFFLQTKESRAASSLSPSATFTVDSTSDAVDANIGDGMCSTVANECTLRAAIQESNAITGTDEIRLPAGVYTLTLFEANEFEDESRHGDLDITDNLTITGTAEDKTQTIISGNGTNRVIHNFAQSSISNVTIQLGNAYDELHGSGIRNEGSLTLNNLIVKNNGNAGGSVQNQGIATSGPLTITTSTIELNGFSGITSNWPASGSIHGEAFSKIKIIDSEIKDNTSEIGISTQYSTGFAATKVSIEDSVISGHTYAGINAGRADIAVQNSTVSNNGFGVAIYESILTITESEISDNTTRGVTSYWGRTKISESTITHNGTNNGVGDNPEIGKGGGVYTVGGTMDIEASSIIFNIAIDGAGLHLSSYYTNISNSTISNNNVTGTGGGIYNTSKLSLMSSTIVQNSAILLTGGLYHEQLLTDEVLVHVGNTVIADNEGVSADCLANFDVNSFGYNLIENGAGCLMLGDTETNLYNTNPVLFDISSGQNAIRHHSPMQDSPLVDGGNPEGCKQVKFLRSSQELNLEPYTSFAYDQLNKVRHFDGSEDGVNICDIGAVEYNSIDLEFTANAFLPIAAIP